jgi:hypothetical protein
MARGYAKYSEYETDELYSRKLAERHANPRLGPAGCKAIHAAGFKSCATCPHLARGKTPLHLSEPSTPPARTGNPNQEDHRNPVVTLMELCKRGAPLQTVLATMNETYAVVRYGGEIVVAIVKQDKIEMMKTDQFHKMFANLVLWDGEERIQVSRRWFDWDERRQYVDRGIVFEPGGPLEVYGDMLNLWRGLGIEPAPGDWSLMRSHLLDVVCSGNREYFEYLIQWMARHVQHPGEPVGVAVALLGAPGAGKGIVARTFGSFFGERHFAHIVHGDQLTGHFNHHLATACVVFLDEALWAGDRKGEGVLKALITEPVLTMEAKFRDPIMVANCLALMVASNSDWAVPVGFGDRRWFVLNVKDTYAGMIHKAYWDALHHQMEAGGDAAMLYDLLAMDLGQFNVRAIPTTAAKAQQQAHSFHGTLAWLYEVLQEGAIGRSRWSSGTVTDSSDHAYSEYVEFSKKRREHHPEIKSSWSRKVREVLGPCVKDVRPTLNGERVRSFEFAPLEDCRRQFADHVGARDLEWEETDDDPTDRGAPQTDADGNEETAMDKILNDLNHPSPGSPGQPVP